MHFPLLITLLLLACTPEKQAPGDFPPALSPTPPPTAVVEPPSTQDAALENVEGEGTGGYVEDYYGGNGPEALASDIIGNGQPSLLFFFAAWCPLCHQKEATLKKIYGEGEYPVSTYKLHYDEAMSLKARYGVTTQDTMVLIDGSGMAMQMVVGANETDLAYLLSRR